MKLKTLTLLVAIAALPMYAYCQDDVILLKCQRISQEPDEAIAEISLKNKTISLDSIEERVLWDQFNRFLRSKDLQTFPFQPVDYKITKISGPYIFGTQVGLFPMHGSIKINRNTLFLTASLYRRNVQGSVFESSYKCERTNQGF